MTAALIFFMTQVLCPASPSRRALAVDQGVRPLLELLARIRRLFIVRSRFGRELILIGGALLFGLILVPLAIWFVGNRILGPYTHGSNLHAGPMALLGDIFEGLHQIMREMTSDETADSRDEHLHTILRSARREDHDSTISAKVRFKLFVMPHPG